MNARKGLKREGMRRYSVTGPNGTWIIERERHSRFLVHPRDWPRAPGGKGRKRDIFFQTPPFSRLSAARLHAEQQAGVQP